MTTREMIAVMEHFDRGGKVQLKFTGDHYDWKDCIHSPTWDWVDFDYRIKPEPKVIPWTFENAPISIKVKARKNNNNNGSRLFNLSFNERTNEICYYCILNKWFVSFREVSEDYIQLDGSPCGTISQ